MWLIAVMFCPCPEKFADTLRVCPLAAVSWQAVPVHAPLKPVKLAPAAGVAVSVIAVPLAKGAVQVPGQLIPAGALVTVPLPETVTLTWAGKELKVTETDWFPESKTLQDCPLHAPPKPANWNPEAAVALSATVVPTLKLAVQVPGQLIPPGLLVTVPLPVVVTVICACWEEEEEVEPPPPHAVSTMRKANSTHGTRKSTCPSRLQFQQL